MPADRDACPKWGGQSRTPSTHRRSVTLAHFTLTHPHGLPSSPRSWDREQVVTSAEEVVRFHLPRSPDLVL